jgi:hypothetical protein
MIIMIGFEGEIETASVALALVVAVNTILLF